MKIHSYLSFDGTAEAAMHLYAAALGGTMTEIRRFGAMPGAKLPEELKNRVMHVGLNLPGGQAILASDTLPGMGPPRVQGTNFSLSIHPSSREEADRIFAALADGGTITMPMADQFWGAYFGMLTDRFGVQWMVNLLAQRG